MSDRVGYLLYYSAATANIMPVTSVCNVSCLFCSHKNNPPGVDAYRLPPLALEKVRDLMGYLDASRKIVIGESVTKIYEGEPFTHPEFFAILEMLRKAYPETILQITTNGTLLTEAAVCRLAGLQPLELNLSLNSAGIEGRRRLMRDRSAQVAVESPELLASYGIPFHGSIVGLPHLAGWLDIRETCRKLENCGAQTIRLFFPGFPAGSPLACFYPEGSEVEFAAEVETLAGQLKAPLTLEPFVPTDVEARLEGVIAASPAACAGLRRGDVIESVDGVAVRSRVDAFQRLMKRTTSAIVFRRDGLPRKTELVRSSSQRPGVVMHYDIDFSLVDRIRNMAADRRRAAVAVLTSQLAYPLWRKVFASESGIVVFPVTSRYFGGTIKCAGLLTVNDYRQAIDDLSQTGKYDLILISGISFDPAGKDLTGESYLSLETYGSEIVTL